MGTRYEDQPVEQWAGPESLDPTPVWKQYILVAALLAVGLIVVVAAAIPALAPQFVRPPALVLGDRLVLALTDVPIFEVGPRLVASPTIDDARAFYLIRPAPGELIALRRSWRPIPSEPACTITPQPRAATSSPIAVAAVFTAMDCAVVAQPGSFFFDARGAPTRAFSTTTPSYRGLDQYLVSVSGDRVIVNLSRVIESSERTSGPVPTGIPQPQTQQP